MELLHVVFGQNYKHPWWGIIFRNVRRGQQFILGLNYIMFPLVLYPPSFEAVYCYICSRRRVAVSRYLMICLVLRNLTLSQRHGTTLRYTLRNILTRSPTCDDKNIGYSFLWQYATTFIIISTSYYSLIIKNDLGQNPHFIHQLPCALQLSLPPIM